MKYLSKCFVAIIILVSLSSAQQVWQKNQGNPVIENIVSAAPYAGSQCIIEVYFCRLVAGEYSQTIKMAYLK